MQISCQDRILRLNSVEASPDEAFKKKRGIVKIDCEFDWLFTADYRAKWLHNDPNLSLT